MNETDTMSILVQFVQSNDFRSFIDNLKMLSADVLEFTDALNDKEKENAIQWCREEKVYLIHKIFEKVTHVDSIKFIKNNLSLYKKNHLLDDEERTWLHVAVKNNRKEAILDYLLNEIEIEVSKTDLYSFTALHIACMKPEYIEGELTILIKQPNQLIARTFDDVTPLELACTDKNKLKELKHIKTVDLNELLGQIDKISKGLLTTEDYYYNSTLSKEKLWLSLLQKNNKYRLISYIRHDGKFLEKYYLKSKEIFSIFSKCQENGQGILTYIKDKYLINTSQLTLERLFTKLTGLNVKETSGDEQDEEKFYTSSLFLAIITGRFDLASALLTCCQFHIISYGLLTCLICHNLSLVSDFPDQVIENIKKFKDFCEKYSMSVLSRTMFRDYTEKKSIISGFLNKPNLLGGQRILDIAYLAKCSKFLSLPSCQGALTNLWKRKTRKCPALKFYLHSSIHCIFLVLFSYFLVHNFYSRMSAIEILCYIYGLGYFMEESRQIYIYREKDFLKSYLKDASNYIDIGSLGFMLLGFILRMSLRVPTNPNQDDIGLFEESKSIYLVVLRIILCLSLILFFMRIIYFGSIFEQLGPKLKMISKMIVTNLMPLIFIFIVFITSFGITFQALLYPNSFYALNESQSFEKKSIPFIIGDIFKRTTYTIFHTHYALEEMEHRETTYHVNYEGNMAVFFLLVIFMIVVNIMLLNLLIALFSYTVQNIIQKSSESWKMNRYKDIKEYYDRSLLPPPLNICEIIIELILTRTNKPKILQINIEAGYNSVKTNLIDEKNDLSMSFRVIQAIALRDNRHKLIVTAEDEEYERKTEIKAMKKAIEKIEKTITERKQQT